MIPGHPRAPGVASVPRLAARAIAGIGIAVDAALFILKAPGPFTVATHLFALWLMLPWFFVLLLAWRYDLPGLLAGVVLAAVFEGIAFYLAFVAPHGSTAALVYAVKPVWQNLLLAIGLAGGRLRARVQRRGTLGADEELR